ncbi:hypothetical protein QAD02_016082, partial [Eretmocerus hayati]
MREIDKKVGLNGEYENENTKEVSSSIRKRRFVGGHRLFFGDPSPMASIIYKKNHICSGTIIDNTTILTAAECIFDKWHKKLLVRTAACTSMQNGNPYQVDRIAFHPDYFISNKTYNVALLKIDGVMKFCSNVKPMPLFEKFDLVPADEVSVVYRRCLKVSSGEPPKNKILLITVDMKAKEDCVEKLENSETSFDPDSEICSSTADVPTCEADIGGPLIVDGRQAGLLTKPFWCLHPELSKRKACLKMPYMYTEIAAVYDWIQWMKKALAESTRPAVVKYALHSGDSINNRKSQGIKVSGGTGAFIAIIAIIIAITNEKGELFCIGSIVSSKHVLTTVMCASVAVEKFDVRVDRSENETYGKQKHRIVKSFWHKDFHLNNHSKSVNDLAVLQIEPSFTFTRVVKKVSISPIVEAVDQEMSAYTIGW